jgi:N6-L-threonylcarbamoyladenine synthase
VITELLGHVKASAAEIGAGAVIVAGGVAANEGLRRAAVLEQASGSPLAFHFSRRALSTDNAAMIAAAAFPKLERHEFAGFDLKAQAALALA